MKTLRKQSLDELARTTSVIPRSKLMSIIAGDAYYEDFGDTYQLIF